MADMPRELFSVAVPAGAFRLMSYLWTFAGQSDRFVWPGRDRIASDLGFSERTLRRAIADLEQARLGRPARRERGGSVREGWELAIPQELGMDSMQALSEGESPAKDGRGRPKMAAFDHEVPAKVGRDRPKMAATGQSWPAKDGRDRTELAADPAKVGHATFYDQPINHHSSFSNSNTVHAEREREEPVSEIGLLSEWRERGGDPEGLGPWPVPVVDGVQLQRLAMDAQIRERLAEGPTGVELHRAAHSIARAVEAGDTPLDEWRAARVWSRWLDGLLVRVARAARAARRATPIDTTIAEPAGRELDESIVAEHLSSIPWLRAVEAPIDPPDEVPARVDLASEATIERPVLEGPESTVEGLQTLAASWSRCRECGRTCTGSLGLHRHVRSAHEIDAWQYYQRWPVTLLLRALHESILEESPIVVVAGPCWIHGGVPDRWGARLRVAGAPTSALYRLTYWVANREFPAAYACHVCDNPQCVNPLHVWDGSPRENALDRDSKGRGKARRRALSDDQIATAIAGRAAGRSFAALARDAGVSPETMRRALPPDDPPECPPEASDDIPF